jgi:hypothetical protein
MGKRGALVLALMLCTRSLLAVDEGKAKYIGGTLADPGLKVGEEQPINLKGEDQLFYANGKLIIPWSSVLDVEYGQKVGHRIGTAILLGPIALFKKAKHHYVTVAYKDKGDKEQAVVLEFDKDDIRMALASLKARTGKEITFQDENARKAMGGGASRPE